MAEVEARPIDAPEPNDDDFLERMQRTIEVAKNFKLLVIDLCPITEEYNISDHPGPDQEIDHERIPGPYHISYGAYDVKPSRAAEIERTTHVESTISLSTSAGGRSYTILTETELGGLLVVRYFEDRPVVRGPEDTGIHNVLDRFHISRESARGNGIRFPELDIVDTLTTGIRAVKDAGRLISTEKCGLLDY